MVSARAVLKRIFARFAGQLLRQGGAADPALGGVTQSAGGALEFDPATLPWIDREDADIAGYVAALGGRAPKEYDLREKLEHWRKYGYAIFPRLIPELLIDAYLADVAELVAGRAKFRARVLAEGLGIKPIGQFTLEQLESPHVRLMNFHNQSVAAKQIILYPQIVSFCEHLFRDRVVAMQTLTFWRSSEQWTHQDFAYVVAQIPSHLCATWVALEDVDPEAGPLEYFPGSHRLPKFDFGQGMFLLPDSSKTDIDFRDYLERECAEAGIEVATFAPRKGDVLFWHAALAHRGGRVVNRALTRRSLVTHYSSATAYPRDRRAARKEPRVFVYNGGLVYGDPELPEQEDIFSRGRSFQL